MGHYHGTTDPIPEPKAPRRRRLLNDEEEPRHRPSIVERVNNRIYFYSSIESESILKLNKELMELDSDHIGTAMKNSDDHLRPIWLHINSHGGLIFDGLAAMDQVSLCKCPVYTVVDGVCASSATFMAVKGKRRFIKPNSFMLIHQVSSGLWGKYEEFVDEMENLEKMMDVIQNIYKKYTRIPKKLLDDIMKRDVYFDAKECLKYGLVDEILK